MRLQRKLLAVGVLVLCVSGIISWSLFSAQSAPTHPLDQMMPEGALLYIEAKDFSSLLKDWNGSAERAQWLKSDDYRVFSNSRLFLRLGEASDQFAAAAGLPPNMQFLTQAAGKESALALYDIGNLELLYITRLPSAGLVQSQLWQSRNKFQPRTAAGRQFYARKDEKSGRVVAFSVADDYLILGTREDLVAGALELMLTGKGRSVRQEGWYTRSVAAASATPGDLRMVMNLEKLAVTPHFRTYWVQRNITEMQGYTSAISDLYREGPVYREERTIFPKEQEEDESALTQSAQAVSTLLPSVPRDSGFYQVGGLNARETLAVLRQKILSPQGGIVSTNKTAPQVQLSGGVTGSAADLETRIDIEPARVATADPGEALLRTLETAKPQATLVVQSSRKNSDGVLLAMPAVVAIAAGSDWDTSALQRAAQQMIAPAMTAANLGLEWREVKESGGYFELDGMDPVQMAVRGKIVYFANDAAFLSTVLQTRNQALSQPATYVAGFGHSRERENFYKLTSLMDQGARATEQEPQFFSQNIASFSRTFSKLESQQVIIRQTKDKIQQTVTYRWMP